MVPLGETFCAKFGTQMRGGVHAQQVDAVSPRGLAACKAEAFAKGTIF
jgi:hypothetical protein